MTRATWPLAFWASMSLSCVGTVRVVDPEPRDAARPMGTIDSAVPPPVDAALPTVDAWPPGVTPFSMGCLRRLSDPGRTVVERPCGSPVATLTDNAFTVALKGPERRFNEATAMAAVTTTTWVRVLKAPFPGSVDASLEAWLNTALADSGPDVLEMAAQYLEGAPAMSGNGLQIAGDADYGPTDPTMPAPDGGTPVRLEGADFNDYLGVPWTYANGVVDNPKPGMIRSIDCSGYMRMLWGYRLGLPMAPGPAPGMRVIPRRAVQIEVADIGVVIIPNDLLARDHVDRLQTGDLLFFDAETNDGTAIDHVGMYLGIDEKGRPRFVSSRKSPNGPTMGDFHGPSVLDGTSLYPMAFRSARRL